MKRMIFPHEQIKEIAKRVTESREVKNISQRELAKAVEVKKDVIRRIESAELSSIDTNLIHKIADVLECNASYLLLEKHQYYSKNPNMHYLQFPEMRKTVDGFVYGRGHLYSDIEYMAKYMNEDYQDKVLDMMHTMIMFHKLAVHFPDVTPEKAQQFSPNNFIDSIKENFFSSANKKRNHEEL